MKIVVSLILIILVGFIVAGFSTLLFAMFGLMIIAAFFSWALGVPISVTTTRKVNGVEVKEKRKYRWFTRVA